MDGMYGVMVNVASSTGSYIIPMFTERWSVTVTGFEPTPAFASRLKLRTYLACVDVSVKLLVRPPSVTVIGKFTVTGAAPWRVTVTSMAQWSVPLDIIWKTTSQG